MALLLPLGMGSPRPPERLVANVAPLSLQSSAASASWRSAIKSSYNSSEN
jgi:hypothetical protein